MTFYRKYEMLSLFIQDKHFYFNNYYLKNRERYFRHYFFYCYNLIKNQVFEEKIISWCNLDFNISRVALTNLFHILRMNFALKV